MKIAKANLPIDQKCRNEIFSNTARFETRPNLFIKQSKGRFRHVDSLQLKPCFVSYILRSVSIPMGRKRFQPKEQTKCRGREQANFHNAGKESKLSWIKWLKLPSPFCFWFWHMTCFMKCIPQVVVNKFRFVRCIFFFLRPVLYFFNHETLPKRMHTSQIINGLGRNYSNANPVFQNNSYLYWADIQLVVSPW